MREIKLGIYAGVIVDYSGLKEGEKPLVVFANQRNAQKHFDVIPPTDEFPIVVLIDSETNELIDHKGNGKYTVTLYEADQEKIFDLHKEPLNQ